MVRRITMLVTALLVALTMPFGAALAAPYTCWDGPRPTNVAKSAPGRLAGGVNTMRGRKTSKERRSRQKQPESTAGEFCEPRLYRVLGS